MGGHHACPVVVLRASSLSFCRVLNRGGPPRHTWCRLTLSISIPRVLSSLRSRPQLDPRCRWCCVVRVRDGVEVVWHVKRRGTVRCRLAQSEEPFDRPLEVDRGNPHSETVLTTDGRGSRGPEVHGRSGVGVGDVFDGGRRRPIPQRPRAPGNAEPPSGKRVSASMASAAANPAGRSSTRPLEVHSRCGGRAFHVGPSRIVDGCNAVM